MLPLRSESSSKRSGHSAGAVVPLVFTGDDVALVAALKLNHPGDGRFLGAAREQPVLAD